MKVRVDRSRCSGHALCHSEGPDVYVLDDGGYCAIGELEIDPSLEEQARRGALVCPERAITVDAPTLDAKAEING
jgi:ferredoxin